MTGLVPVTHGNVAARETWTAGSSPPLSGFDFCTRAPSHHRPQDQQRSSWPGSTRPSTSSGATKIGVDARIKSGHDDCRLLTRRAWEPLPLNQAGRPCRTRRQMLCWWCLDQRRLALSRSRSPHRPSSRFRKQWRGEDFLRERRKAPSLSLDVQLLSEVTQEVLG